MSYKTSTRMIQRKRSSRVMGVALSFLAMGLGLCLAVAPAFAMSPSPLDSELVAGPLVTQPPQLQGELRDEHVYATRATLEEQVETFGAVATWRAEYATSEKALGEGSGTPAGAGTIEPGGDTTISIGAPDATTGTNVAAQYCVLHHLDPSSTYYARFVLEDAEGTTSKIFKFTTLPVNAPEIPRTALGQSTFKFLGGTATTGAFTAQIETNGAVTEYHFEYSTSGTGGWKPFSSGASGVVTVAEDFADPEARLTGLTPETTYYVRVVASNGQGVAEQDTYGGAGDPEPRSYTTPTLRPVVGYGATVLRNVTASTARAFFGVNPNRSRTEWRYEYTTEPENTSSWRAIAGSEGVVPQAQAEGLPEGHEITVAGSLTGLSPSTQYCVRLYASNAAGVSKNYLKEVRCFDTAGPPEVVTESDHALHGESVRLLGSGDSISAPTSNEQTIGIGGAPTGGTFTLTFKGQTTVPIAADASSTEIRNALEALPSIGPNSIAIEGVDGGPYIVAFSGDNAEVFEPQITADPSGLTPSGTGSVTVVTVAAGGEGYDTRLFFEYVTQEQYESSGFAEAAKTLEQPVAPGTAVQPVGEDVSGLQPGLVYRYRLVAASTFPGHPLVQGEVQSFTAPAPVTSEEPAACPNPQFRTGASASLPDCRAYEQVTPVDKEGAQEPYNYGGAISSGALVGEDGEHIILENPAVSWGSGPNSGQSPYFFTREEANDTWGMLSGSPQPQTGVQQVEPELYNDDLTRVAVEVDVHTSLGGGESKEVGFESGPAGGPYALVASVPRTQLAGKTSFYEGWVAASADFSKLILQVEDHELGGARTETKSGTDLYEYSAGALRQVNLGVGRCGAHIVKGDEPDGVRGSSNAVSADGSRVFFEAIPGSSCSGSVPAHLFVRKNGAETVDLGAYRFAGANPQGTEVLLASTSGEVTDYFVDDLESGASKEVFSGPVSEEVGVSEEFKAIYFRSKEAGDVYRYDVPDGTLNFALRVTPSTSGTGIATDISPDGRFYYFHGAVPAVPGENQAFLYDSAEHVVLCVSCASPSDPEPKLGSFFPGGGWSAEPYVRLGRWGLCVLRYAGRARALR
jgi:hypothetical protein